jgi:hypothetical protein
MGALLLLLVVIVATVFYIRAELKTNEHRVKDAEHCVKASGIALRLMSIVLK